MQCISDRARHARIARHRRDIDVYKRQVLALGIVLLGVGMHAFSKSMENHVQKEMTEETKLILKILDQNYPGEFSLNKDEKGNYHIYKGGKDITKDTEFIDNMKDIMGVDVTLFCQDVRLQTTLRDAKGRLFINTAVSSVITKDVLKKKKPHFYQSTTTVSNERNFAYYEPIFLQDGTCFGMVGVCRLSLIHICCCRGMLMLFQLQHRV